MTTSPIRTPWHLWLIGVISLLWNAMGGYDYIMTQSKNADYMAKFTPEQLEFFYGFPTWVVAAWAIAVWASVVGSVFLILRKRWAEPLFLVSLISMILTVIHNYGLSNGLEVAGDTFSLVFTAIIFLVSTGLWLYARAMHKRGVIG